MPYQTDIRVFEDHVRAEVSGARTPGMVVPDAIQVGQQISDACRDAGVSRLLVILRMTGRLSPTESYEIFSDPQAYGWSRDVKVALVDMNEDSKDDSLFSETVAVNRAYQMSVFDDENEAREWLLES